MIRFPSASADPTASAASRHALAILMAALPGLHVDVLDDVAEIARRIPERPCALRLADPVEGTYHQTMLARAGRRPGHGPLSEGVLAEARPKREPVPFQP